MQLDLLTFRRIRPSDAKEYKEALHESIESVGVFKWGLVDEIGQGKRNIALNILWNQIDESQPDQHFVLMAGKRLVAKGYVVKRENSTWVEVGLWVRSQYQGMGVGEYMLRKLTEYSLENFECDGVYLVHEASNGAMASLASKVGFEIAEAKQREPAEALDKRLIEDEVISGFDVHRIMHNPKSKKGVRTKYGVKWSDPQNRPLSQKIQIIPYWHLET